MMPDTSDTQAVLDEARTWLLERPKGAAYGLIDRSLVERVFAALGREANKALTDCGTRHLVDERALRVVERFGWPADLAMLEWLSASAESAGQAYNSQALGRGDEVPF